MAGNLIFCFPKKGNDHYSIKSSSNLTSEGIIQSEIERGFRKSPTFLISEDFFIQKLIKMFLISVDFSVFCVFLEIDFFGNDRTPDKFFLNILHPRELCFFLQIDICIVLQMRERDFLINRQCQRNSEFFRKSYLGFSDF